MRSECGGFRIEVHDVIENIARVTLYDRKEKQCPDVGEKITHLVNSVKYSKPKVNKISN